MDTAVDQDVRAKVWDLIKDMPVAVVVTRDGQGRMGSRPMVAGQPEFDGFRLQEQVCIATAI